jgi:ABC-type antimicrobial peptide transport system permease subunit
VTPPSTQLAEVRRVLRQIEPAAGIEVATLFSSIGFAFLPSQVGAVLLGSIGLLGLLLAAIGLYGVMAYSVARRTREIGVRMAIGAGRRDISRMILLEAARLLMIGSIIGLAMALFVTKPLAMFFVPGLSPKDPATFASVVLVLAATGLLATVGPIRRAISISPLSSLRYE